MPSRTNSSHKIHKKFLSGTTQAISTLFETLKELSPETTGIYNSSDSIHGLFIKQKLLMEENANFIGNGKEIGQKIQIVLRWDDLKRIWRWKNKQGKMFVTLDVIKRKNVSEWGHTHAVVEHKILKTPANKTG